MNKLVLCPLRNEEINHRLNVQQKRFRLKLGVLWRGFLGQAVDLPLLFGAKASARGTSTSRGWLRELLAAGHVV